MLEVRDWTPWPLRRCPPVTLSGSSRQKDKVDETVSVICADTSGMRAEAEAPSKYCVRSDFTVSTALAEVRRTLSAHISLRGMLT